MEASCVGETTDAPALIVRSGPFFFIAGITPAKQCARAVRSMSGLACTAIKAISPASNRRWPLLLSLRDRSRSASTAGPILRSFGL